MLAVQAVKIPCLNVRDTEGIILHSDLGSQYTNQAFESYLSTKGMIHSFSRKGNPYDYAPFLAPHLPFAEASYNQWHCESVYGYTRILYT